jgi:hypothetical protein
MTNIFVKPAAADMLVRDPVSLKPLDAKGEWKPRTQFWSRRLRDKDVVEAEPPAQDAPPATAAVSDTSATDAAQAPPLGILAALQRDAAT